jgi:hypothetical protein
MGRFSLSTASLVLLYKGSPTCPVMASRVSCLSSNPFPLCPLLPVAETVLIHDLATGQGGSTLSDLISMALDFAQQSLQSKGSRHRQ